MCRRREVPRTFAFVGERAGRVRCAFPQRPPLVLKPVLRTRRVRHEEPRQQIAAIQLERFARSSGHERLVERARVAPESISIETQLVSTTDDDVFGELATEEIDRAVEGSA